MSSSPEPTSPRVPWWYPTLRKLAVLSLVLALIGGVFWLVWHRTHCASGIRRIGGECIGVTDGRFVFPGTGADLAGVMKKINDQNRQVEQTGEPYVSIAYLVALPKEADNKEADNLSAVLRRELQGAYLAQLLANDTDELGDRPLIRLLVANAGEGNNCWQPVVGQLLAKVNSPDQLVAVAGLGQSRETTFEAIEELTAQGVSAIAARLTADDDRSRIEGLVRVAPGNTDQVKAAVAYLKRKPEVRRALVVHDDDKQNNPYAVTLSKAFQSEFPDDTHDLLEPFEEYVGSLPGVSDRFVQMMPSICRQQPDVVFFAGRGNDLEAFIEVLQRRPCPDFHINVMAGDSTDTLDPTKAQNGLTANATLRYTSHAHPDAWARAPDSFPFASIRLFRHDCVDPDPDPNCFKDLFPGEPLGDAAAIMGHDTVVTAVKAIRSAAGQRNLVDDPITPGDVVQQLGGLHEEHAVPGASGWISLDGGMPVNKAIPILELKPDGSRTFDQLSSPTPPPFTPPR